MASAGAVLERTRGAGAYAHAELDDAEEDALAARRDQPGNRDAGDSEALHLLEHVIYCKQQQLDFLARAVG